MTHTPVLAAKVIALFQPKPNDVLLDATVGHGGHAKAYLEATAPSGRVVGLDADLAALQQAASNLEEYQNRVTLINANFTNLKDSLTGGGILSGGSTLTTDFSGNDAMAQPLRFNHILYDLGIGSHQLADEQRGFSFQKNAPLTMKFGRQKDLPDSKLSSLNWLTKKLDRYPDATDLIAKLSETELAEIIRSYGEEKFAGRIATAIKKGQPETSSKLAECVSDAVPRSYEGGRIHPATRTFQALRIAVNRELEVIEHSLPEAMDLLLPQGKLAVISFHSLEDRIVKNLFRNYAKLSTKLLIITKKPITAEPSEIKQNPRARSAKLRLIQRE